MSPVSLLQSREQRYIKTINNNTGYINYAQLVQTVRYTGYTGLRAKGAGVQTISSVPKQTKKNRASVTQSAVVNIFLVPSVVQRRPTLSDGYGMPFTSTPVSCFQNSCFR